MNRTFFSLTLSAVLIFAQIGGFVFLNNQTIAAQSGKNAAFRGYRTGYSDGYMSGYRDMTGKTARSYQKHADYKSANRAFSKDYGKVEDYRGGYQQGYANGYNAGYDKREFDSAVPANLGSGGAAQDVSEGGNSDGDGGAKPRINPTPRRNPPARSDDNQSYASGEPLVIIPANTELIVEILSDISTDGSRRNDSFKAKIVAPYEIEGAIIEGRVAELRRPGRIKRRAELQLSFDRIVLSEARWANMTAMIVEALPDEANPKNNVKSVDAEGTVMGKSSLKSDVIIVGTTTGTGATVGAIAGGPVGFAVGAAVGGAFGLGGILVARGKDIKLSNGQRLRIRTNYETQIR